jgi:YfiH family protein
VIELRVGRATVWFTDRHGGRSSPPYDAANLADHVGDDPVRVATNRRLLADVLAARAPGTVPADPARWVWLRQVHGAAVTPVATAPATPPEADAAVTRVSGLPLVVQVADCAPIALVAPDAVAVVHAGWAGIERGVIGAAVRALREAGGDPVTAVVGPCIHPERYEFGADLLARLVDAFGDEVAGRTADGRPALDVPAATRVELARAGVTAVTDVDVCTAASPDHFSARRDGTTGRQAVVVVLGAS